MSGQNAVHGSKLDSASLLILGMEGLRPGKLMPVSQAAVDAADTPSDAVDRQRYGVALTCAVLYPIVVELVVKHIWEQEQAKTAPYHHNVHSLFAQLRPETQREVEALYDKCCSAYKSAIDAGQQQHGAEAVAVDMAELEEALRWNKDAVTNLKYEMTPRGKSVPTGIFWNSNRLWVVPGTFPNFAIKLTRWAASRKFTSPAP